MYQAIRVLIHLTFSNRKCKIDMQYIAVTITINKLDGLYKSKRHFIKCTWKK
jgi:hypothetical protein